MKEDPFDVLANAYEKMFESVAKGFHNAEKKSAELLHELIDKAKDEAVELEEVSREDAEKLSTYVKRDLGEAASHMSISGQELKDWLGFETTLLENEFVDQLLKLFIRGFIRFLALRTQRSYKTLGKNAEKSV